MYTLKYKCGDITAIARNYDPKILRKIIVCLKKTDTWELFNFGGIKIDSSEENKGGQKNGSGLHVLSAPRSL